VFGCGGDRDTSKRAAMGAAAGRADHVVLTDDNPRSEDPAEIVAGILAGLGEHSDVVVEHDRATAIRYAVSQARAGDVVLVAGRGHERRQLRNDSHVAFDDREFVARVLEVPA
jgi:UDP-N-acetylmuramoyl-L-alanyl-D-glutamate--2,6-diaminopimelate ligase